MSLETQLRTMIDMLKNSDTETRARKIYVNSAFTSDLTEIDGIPIHYFASQEITIDRELAPIAFGLGSVLMETGTVYGSGLMRFTLEINYVLP